MSELKSELKPALARLAQAGVFLGTSSWKYPGWCGALYDPGRYQWRGKFAESRFNRACLQEYAEVFKTVCVDAAYYSFPTEKYLKDLANQVPPDFLFGLKVTDSVTVKRFPNLERFGERAGKPNPDFLNAEPFIEEFLGPCEAIRSNLGLLIFEFSRFWRADYPHGREFVAHLERFLDRLPPGWPYAIELRNRAWLKPEYFECLSRHQVTHVFNSWDAMPPVTEQMAMAGSRTNSACVAARFLLKPGRKYAEAVTAFQPYDRVQERNPEARAAGRALVAEGVAAGPARRTFIFVNNRLEGNALGTIAGLMSPEAI
ncbi:MAG TPA: DUF72 domain-containing protein [Verrucomicrobiae bacterium]|nr:DUF72 domain-containing protein [Verrucomicrobiae bacterium]